MLIFCCSYNNENKKTILLQSADIATLPGHTFINTDTTNTLAGLYFENDSILHPLYRVCFDTLFEWKYRLINQSLYRYTLITNELIARDSVISSNDSVLVLGSFMPDTDKKISFQLAAN